MAVEKILEKPAILKKPETPPPAEKPGHFENLAEKIRSRTEIVSEKKIALPQPGENGQAGASLAQSFQKQRAAAIDLILAEGLNEVFLKMNAQEQKEFQRKGEETVVKINELLSQTKVKVNKIIDLIKAWLKMIPGINRFFLEQEAKIKADKILQVKDKF